MRWHRWAAAPLVLWLRFRADPEWAVAGRLVLVLALASAVAMAVFASRAAQPWNGALQRAAVTLALAAEAVVAVRMLTPADGASVAWREHHWTMDLGHLNAELDWLAGAIEHAGGHVTERDLNYVEDSAELLYTRNGERYEIHLKRLPDPLHG